MRTHRTRIIAGLAVVACLTSGCSALGTSDLETGGSEESAAPTPDGTAEEDLIDFSFESGPELATVVTGVAWTDSFASDARFTPESLDDGNGRWTYLDTRNQCAIAFYQGSFSDIDKTPDDRATTDDMLLVISGANDPNVTAEVIAQYGEDARLPIYGTDAVIDARSFGGYGAGGESQIDVGRYFTSLDTGLHVRIFCPTADQDAFAEFDALRSDGFLAAAATPAG